MVRVVSLEYGDEPARTRHINSTESWIEFDYIRARWYREVCNGFVSVERKYGKSSVSRAEQKRSVMLGIHRHSVIELAAFHRVSPRDCIRSGIDLRHFICTSQTHIHAARKGIILRHPRLTREWYGFYNLVVVHRNDRHGFS